MSLRLEMLQVARLARTLLGDEASALVEAYVRSQQNADGGFRDRDGESDLYYTSFAIDALTALQVPLPEESLNAFLESRMALLDELDFVHLCCLARCSSALATRPAAAKLAPVYERIEAYRTPDGGYNQSDDDETGSAYACFLAYGAYADHGLPLPDPAGVARCLDSLKTEGGAWANDVELPIPNVPATAAAVTLCPRLLCPTFSPPPSRSTPSMDSRSVLRKRKISSSISSILSGPPRAAFTAPGMMTTSTSNTPTTDSSPSGISPSDRPA
ncbi:MAG: hypothetical protein NWQ95_03195 [Verrucomicrobiales bacterium]|nr:hypothetical protein [Verrucomicrobiales bacterium]